jgi:hypothetical protein
MVVMITISQKLRNFNRFYALPRNVDSQEFTLVIPEVIANELETIAERLGLDTETLIRVEGIGHLINRYWDHKTDRPKKLLQKKHF